MFLRISGLISIALISVVASAANKRSTPSATPPFSECIVTALYQGEEIEKKIKLEPIEENTKNPVRGDLALQDGKVLSILISAMPEEKPYIQESNITVMMSYEDSQSKKPIATAGSITPIDSKFLGTTLTLDAPGDKINFFSLSCRKASKKVHP